MQFVVHMLSINLQMELTRWLGNYNCTLHLPACYSCAHTEMVSRIGKSEAVNYF